MRDTTMTSRIAAPFWWLTGWWFGYHAESKRKARETRKRAITGAREETERALQQINADFRTQRESDRRPYQVILALNERERRLKAISSAMGAMPFPHLGSSSTTRDRVAAMIGGMGVLATTRPGDSYVTDQGTWVTSRTRSDLMPYEGLPECRPTRRG